jgi:hypothetical protein
MMTSICDDKKLECVFCIKQFKNPLEIATRSRNWEESSGCCMKLRVVILPRVSKSVFLSWAQHLFILELLVLMLRWPGCEAHIAHQPAAFLNRPSSSCLPTTWLSVLSEWWLSRLSKDKGWKLKNTAWWGAPSPPHPSIDLLQQHSGCAVRTMCVSCNMFLLIVPASHFDLQCPQQKHRLSLLWALVKVGCRSEALASDAFHCCRQNPGTLSASPLFCVFLTNRARFGHLTVLAWTKTSWAWSPIWCGSQLSRRTLCILLHESLPHSFTRLYPSVVINPNVLLLLSGMIHCCHWIISKAPSIHAEIPFSICHVLDAANGTQYHKRWHQLAAHMQSC